MKTSSRPRRSGLRRAIAVALAVMGMVAGGATAVAAAPLATTEQPAPFNFNGIVRDGQTPLEGVEITVTGDGVEETVATGADGRWIVGVPAAGTYTVSIDTATLPDGVTLRDASFESREFEVGGSTSVGVLFPFASADGAPAPSPSGGGSPGDGGASGAPTTGEGAAPGGEASTGAASNDFGSQLLSRIISGLNFGLLLALAAIGITLIFGTTGVNNFAHGELLTFGGVVFYATTTLVNWPVWIAIIVTLVASAALGWVHDWGIFKPLRRRRVGLVQVLIVTIGLSIALRYMFQFLIGGGTEGLSVDPGPVLEVGPVLMRTSNVVSTVIAIVVLIAVGLFLTRTRIGKATRAVSDNASLAAASGIDVDRVIRIVWVLAGLLTGGAGILYTYFIGANIKWDVGFTILLLLFAGVTLGGLGSAFGALVGAVVIGLVTEISTLFLAPDLRYAIALLVLILVLLFRPQGILGRRERIG
ncbi:branched-chain amino acid ABC transporter permease [Agrococcus jenensis]|uniref:Amino acid/amide ABC transporter membrane protein 1 (HAAT family) n=1 Tax=Agrococcus jenensis TaxID=46353 RepID=A0A3N2ASR6_9MICO|nr:branched-chain amino acid ABC transporter permease [Agrococcus jenensis]ROR66087.1 amino acid/amide ABC transporter membrane protein 1 (HAAT family) [Agrococcus jenensis]